MKKLISLLITISIISGSLSVFAYEMPENIPEGMVISPNPMATETVSATEAPTETSTQMPEETIAPATEAPTSAPTVTVTATIEDLPFITESEATLSLYSMNDVLIGTATESITKETDTVVFSFNVPVITPGTSYKVRATDGIDSILYYTDRYYPDSDINFPIYVYTNREGEEVLSTDIAVSVRPLFTKSVNLYYNGTATNIAGARVIGEDTVVPVERLAKYMGLDSYYDTTWKSQTVKLGNEYIFFNEDSTYTTIWGEDTNSQCPSVMIDGDIYVSLRTFADAIGAELTVDDHYTHLDIYIGEASKVKEYFSQIPVNQWGISSRTNYMVWVDLSDYKLRLYQGSQYQWKPILETTCAIGAPWTPTVTGSFEYQYRVSGWYYGSYYVGPCLVFYRGYALHSVLLRNNNTEYDGRVGVGISHGCVRLKKWDIDYIANTIPVGTRIYITY